MSTVIEEDRFNPTKEVVETIEITPKNEEQAKRWIVRSDISLRFGVLAFEKNEYDFKVVYESLLDSDFEKALVSPKFYQTI